MKTSELIGPALNWATSEAQDLNYEVYEGRVLTGSTIIDPEGLGWDEEYDPATDWSQAGPIIDREKIRTQPSLDAPDIWLAQQGFGTGKYCYGPTLLIAAMRCFVASKLGDDVEIPEELK